MKHLLLILALANSAELCKSQELDSLTKKNKIAYLVCDTSEIHDAYREAAKELARWNYWQISQDSAKADFILEIVIRKYSGGISAMVETKAIIKNKKMKNFGNLE